MTKKAVVAVAVIVALVFGAVTPSRAQAASTTVLVFGSIAAFVAFVAVGALLTTSRTVPLFLQEMPPADPDATMRKQQPVRFGTQCQPTSNGERPLACW